MVHDAINPEVSIFSLYHICIQSFHDLLDALRNSELDTFTAALQEELGRFIVWAENSGAHRSIPTVSSVHSEN
jgi:hypothetical protein